MRGAWIKLHKGRTQAMTIWVDNRVEQFCSTLQEAVNWLERNRHATEAGLQQEDYLPEHSD